MSYRVPVTRTRKSRTPTQHFAESVRRYRRARDWTQPQLAERCQAAGLDWDRSIIANVEAGRRASVTLQELAILGLVLQVPPVLLAFPLGIEASTEATPGDVVPTWDAVRWFIGEAPLDPAEVETWEQAAAPLYLYRTHERLVGEWHREKRNAEQAQRRAGNASDEDARRSCLRTAEDAEREAEIREGALWEVRRQMRQHGLKPPTLPAELEQADTHPLERAVRRHYEAKEGVSE